MKRKKVVSFVLLFSFLVVSLFIVPNVFSQPEEEEEEPVQTRPNPIDKTTKTSMGLRSKISSKVHQGKTLQTKTSKQGKEFFVKIGKADKTMGKAKGIASNGVVSGINSNGDVLDAGVQGKAKTTSAVDLLKGAKQGKSSANPFGKVEKQTIGDSAGNPFLKAQKQQTGNQQ